MNTLLAPLSYGARLPPREVEVHRECPRTESPLYSLVSHLAGKDLLSVRPENHGRTVRAAGARDPGLCPHDHPAILEPDLRDNRVDLAHLEEPGERVDLLNSSYGREQ